jgi:hypothetical protein
MRNKRKIAAWTGLRFRGCCLLMGASTFCRAETAVSSPPDFFESKVRPLFVEYCYKCHSAASEKIKGGLRLDNSEAILKGGSSGPALKPGDPDGSLLIKAVRYSDPDLQMPPKKRLSPEQISALEAWIKMGAPLPQITKSAPSLREVAEARARHWAFQPVKKPAIPEVHLKRWVQNPVDNFVLAKMEAKQVKPAPEADRRTLIRRVSYDLIGLPPSNEEVECFVKDPQPGAYGRLVDRLLASPQYGERWARYWLDLARFADTKGYLAGNEERRYAFSYTYRDYVVRAFNSDKPYDQFLIEQIAADLLPKKSEDKTSLAALGFLTLGRRFLNNQDDIIDDRIDVVTRGTMGLTVACARCHDHKFDPIPTKDYYSLHGIFASSHEPAELPLLGPLRDSTDYQDYLKQKGKIESEIPEAKAREVAKFRNEVRQHVGDYLLGVKEADSWKDASKFDTLAGERKLNPAVLRRWMKDLEARSKKADPIFSPWFGLAALKDYSKEAKALMTGFAAGAEKVNPVVAKELAQNATNSLTEAAEVYTRLFKEIDSEWKSLIDTPAKDKKPAPKFLPNPEREALRQVLYADGAAVNVPEAEGETILARKLGEVTAPLKNRIEALNWTHPGAPPRAMALLDRDTPANSYVHVRGNAGNRGEEVPRRFVEILSSTNRMPFTNGSGRLELARAIASPENPLTARVFVNRVWLHHFGEGLVRTPGDFGVRTEEPVERPLLDYLAACFVEHGWSIKYLHKLILLSAAYQQSSDAPPETLRSDPDNRLLTRMNRQRLDFEALRDTLLALAGKLDLKMGGIPVDLQAEPFSTRRTLYGLIDRQNLPAIYRTFDFANPDSSNQGRFHTTVPQQALFLMNSPFVIEQARSLAQRPEVKNCSSPQDRIDKLYRVIFQRPASKEEAEIGAKFLTARSGDSGNLTRLEKYAQVLLLSNEVMFVD